MELAELRHRKEVASPGGTKSEVYGHGVESSRWRGTGADMNGRFGGLGNVEFLRLPLKTKVGGSSQFWNCVSSWPVHLASG